MFFIVIELALFIELLIFIFALFLIIYNSTNFLILKFIINTEIS